MQHRSFLYIIAKRMFLVTFVSTFMMCANFHIRSYLLSCKPNATDMFRLHTILLFDVYKIIRYITYF